MILFCTQASHACAEPALTLQRQICNHYSLCAGRVQRLQEEAEVRRKKELEIQERLRLEELERARLKVFVCSVRERMFGLG